MATIQELRAKFTASVESMQAGIQSIRTQVGGLQNMTADAAKDMSKSFDKWGKKAKDVGGTMTKAVTLPIAGLGAAAIKTSMDFNKNMSRVGAIAGATSQDMGKLKDSALELGAATSKSASEVAKGQEELAAMGFTTKDIIGAMPGVISAAEASGADMAQTAQVMASSLNIFGLEAKDATHVADVLAQTANQSAADITDMQYALKYAGPPAAALGVSLEETSAAIGLMTDAGMKGEQAGTTLRGALLGLLDPSQENSEMMETMGVQITDAQGNFVGLANLVENLQSSMEGMTDTQKAATLSQLVGKEAVSGMLTLMKQGPDKINKYTKALENSDGASKKAADMMMDNLYGALEEMGGAFETLGITIGDKLTPALRWAAGAIQKFTQFFIDLPGPLQTALVVLGGIAAAIGPLLLGFAAFASVASKVLLYAGKYPRVLGLLTRAFAILTGPIGITIGIITALATAFSIAYKKSETFRNLVNKIGASIVSFGQVALKPLVAIFDKVKKAFEGVMLLFSKGTSTDYVKGFAMLKDIFPPEMVTAIVRSVTQIKGAIDKVKSAFKGLFNLFAPGTTKQYVEGVKLIKNAFPEDVALGIIRTVTKVKDAFKNVTGAVQGVFKLFSKGTSKEYMEGFKIIHDIFPPEVAQKIISGVYKVKQAFQSLKDGAKSIFSTLGAFINEKFGEINAFWQKEGPAFKEAVKNIFSGIGSAIKDVLPVVKMLATIFGEAFKIILKVITASMPVISVIFKAGLWVLVQIVKSIWGNIQGVIEGGMRLIGGLIKVFSGLFTGDFKKMWSGIKDIFFGALRLIWNAVQLMMWGKLLKGVLSVGKLLVNAFKGTWTNIFTAVRTFAGKIVTFVRDKFTQMGSKVSGTLSKLLQAVRSIFGRMKDFVVNTATRIATNYINAWKLIFRKTGELLGKVFRFVKDTFGKMKESVSSGVRFIGDKIKNAWSSILNRTKDRFSAIYNAIKNSFTKARDFVRNTAKSIYDRTVGTWNNLKRRTGDIFRGIYEGVKRNFDKIVSAAKNLPKRIGDGIRAMKEGVGRGIKSMVNRMAGLLETGLNGVIKGINWVLATLLGESLSKKWKIGKVKIDTYAKGTKGSRGHGGGPALINDGKGGNAGRELVRTPDGEYYLPAGKNVVVDLPKGSHVWSAKETAQMLPAYKNGTKKSRGRDLSALEGFGEQSTTLPARQKAGAKAAKKKAVAVKDYAMELYEMSAGKAMNFAMDKLNIKRPGANDLVTAMVRGGWDKVKKAGIEKIKQGKKAFEEMGGDAPNVTGGAKAWRKYIVRASAFMRAGANAREISGIMAQIQRESGGNQKIIQSPKVVDINTLSGNPAKGLLQYIPQTFRAYAMKGHNNIFSGMDQLLAFFNNSNWRRDLPYGKRGWGPTGHRRFENGGIVDQKQLAWIADGGWAESIISHDPAKRASQYKIWEKTGRDLGFLKGGDTKEVVQLLERIAQAVEESPDISNLAINMDGRTVGRLVEPHVTNAAKQKEKSALRAKGVQT